MRIPWHILSKDEVYDYLDRSYNSPTIRTEEDEERFADEWWSVRGDLVDIFSLFGTQDDLGGGDFCVAESRATSRGINASITASTVLSDKVVSLIVDMLQQQPEAYSISVFSENTPLFWLFVERDRLLIECDEYPELIDLLNLEKEDAQQAGTSNGG